ncbi:MAG: glucokinase [Gammaproteobacteria bacterium]|nr:MAG: glucokinase [Gammaproteobacteria bacterium]TND03940.1 MAG: glucokinase [Gammaproteobacteria bacterium]
MNVISGDVGGTKTLLQIAEVHDGAVRSIHEQRFDNHRFASFDEIARCFLDDAPADVMGDLQAVCIAVAGPIEDTEDGRRVDVTNLPWSLEEPSLATLFDTRRVRLINDFEAVAYGTEALTSADFLVLQRGLDQPHGNRMTLGAGTGFGCCQSLWQGDRYLVMPSEAGHADFAPTDATQIALLSHLLDNASQVEIEQVLSGPGLKTIFDFLRESRGISASVGLRDAMHDGDAVAAIAQFGKTQRDPLASDALDTFVKIYGAVAGNLALLCLPYGGIFIAGGIAPKLSAVLADGRFTTAFRNKGKMSALMARFPLHIVRDEGVGMKGAALVASRI